MDEPCDNIGKRLEWSSEVLPLVTNKLKKWFVMRDLKRWNAQCPAYKQLQDLGITVFTPMIWKLIQVHGKRMRKQVPFMQDMLFVFDSRQVIDPIVERVPTLQYRFLRGTYREPMTVRNEDMERFIKAVGLTENPRYYTPEELTPAMVGKKVRIIGGPLDGYEGRLQKMQGSQVKRLFVEIPSLLVVSVEVNPEYIQFV